MRFDRAIMLAIGIIVFHLHTSRACLADLPDVCAIFPIYEDGDNILYYCEETTGLLCTPLDVVYAWGGPCNLNLCPDLCDDGCLLSYDSPPCEPPPCMGGECRAPAEVSPAPSKAAGDRIELGLFGAKSSKEISDYISASHPGQGPNGTVLYYNFRRDYFHPEKTKSELVSVAAPNGGQVKVRMFELVFKAKKPDPIDRLNQETVVRFGIESSETESARDLKGSVVPGEHRGIVSINVEWRGQQCTAYINGRD